MLFSLWLGLRLVGSMAGWAGTRQPESIREATQVPYPGLLLGGAATRLLGSQMSPFLEQ